MTILYSKHFLKQYADAPGNVRKAFDKQSGLLLQNLQASLIAGEKVR